MPTSLLRKKRIKLFRLKKL